MLLAPRPFFSLERNCVFSASSLRAGGSKDQVFQDQIMLSTYGIDFRKLRYYFTRVNKMHHAYNWNQKLYKQEIEQKYSVKD
jgi:hypothetical protein